MKLLVLNPVNSLCFHFYPELEELATNLIKTEIAILCELFSKNLSDVLEILNLWIWWYISFLKKIPEVHITPNGDTIHFLRLNKSFVCLLSLYSKHVENLILIKNIYTFIKK